MSTCGGPGRRKAAQSSRQSSSYSGEYAFRRRFARWAPSVQRFLAILNVFLIPYGGNKRSRERLEAGLWRLVEFNGGGRYQEEGIRFRSCREGERHLLVRFARPLPVEGLRRLRTLELPVMADDA